MSTNGSILYSYCSTGKLKAYYVKQKQAYSWVLIGLIFKGQSFSLVFKIILQNNYSYVLKKQKRKKKR